MRPLPHLLKDPEKLAQLAQLLDATPEDLRQAIERDYQHQTGNPLVYESAGAPKASALLRALEQGAQQAREFEARTNSPSHLSHTLEHVQVHLALLVGYYEDRLQGTLAPQRETPHGELLRWRELLSIAPSLHPHQLDEPVLAIITDYHGDTTAFPLKLEHNPADDGERALYTNEAHEDYQIFDVDKEDQEEGLIYLRPLPAGVPLLAFNYMDEDGDQRDARLTSSPLSPKPTPLFTS